MQILLKHITPFYMACSVGIIFLVIIALLGRRDSFWFPNLLVFILILVVVLLIDRLIASRIGYGILFFTELAILGLLFLFYTYANRSIEIRIETSKSFFLVIYDKSGLRKSDIPKISLFQRAMVKNIDSVIHIHESLANEVEIQRPSGWGTSGYSSRSESASMKSGDVTIQIFLQGTGNSERMEQLLNEEKKRLEGNN